MDLYKIYVATKKKDGNIVKSEMITTKADDKEMAIQDVIKQAKGWYGYKGKVHIGGIFKKNTETKQYEKI